MIDTHAHLDFENFDEDREEVIRRAFDNGVKKIVNIGVDLKTSKRSIEIAEGHENIFAAVGFHPEYFTKHLPEMLRISKQAGVTCNMKQSWIGELRDLAKNKKVVAIGECGLDYFHLEPKAPIGALGSQKENQKNGFLAQIELAEELNLPVIVHCRNAWDDLYDILKISKSSALGYDKFVLHCYSGEKKDTEKFLKLPNVYFSFSGNITFPNPTERTEKLAEAVRMIPLDRIMLDSDSPYLAPQAMRGKRNEPANVRYIAEKIAEIKGISGEEVERKTDENAIKFFKIDTN